MGTSTLWALAAVGVAALGCLIWLLVAKKAPPDTTERSALLLAQLTRSAGTRVVDYCVSGDLTACIGIDANSGSLLYCAADAAGKITVPVRQFRASDIYEVEIVEDGEPIAKTARTSRLSRAGSASGLAPGVSQWRDPKPRAFSTVRTLRLRIVVNDQQRVYLFNLLGTDTMIERTDPVCIYAMQVGERWFELISGLIAAGSREAIAQKPVATFESHSAVGLKLAEYLRQENGEEEGEPAPP